MMHSRHGAVGVLLSNGKVLIIGDAGSPSDAPGTADLFDPATGTVHRRRTDDGEP